MNPAIRTNRTGMKAAFEREESTGTRTPGILADVRFPVIEALLKDGLVDEVIAHIQGLCMSISQNRSWKKDFDLSLNSEAALSGLNETMLLLETLRTLNNEIRNRHLRRGDFR